ncbi:hypothetical protein [Veillonella tobetsuensis]|uniref:hypothetical protein n=1 Tax=Veillonella tobetsuensis TaxID=1110546 RepID=UPI00248D6A5A|nr:hypothetical protein [Veillonella tobetsuensis]
MSKKKLFIAALVAVVAIILGWYFLYFTKTPVYSLNLAREAVEKHDVNAFKKHVDMDSIIGSSYDDVVAMQLEDPEIKNSPFRDLAEVMFQGLKPKIVPILSNEIYSAIAKQPENSEQNAREKQAADEMKEKTGVKDLEFKSIGSATVDGNSAVVPVTFNSQELNQDVTFNLAMKKLDDGTWQAVKINNFKEFLALVEQHEKQGKAK